MNGKLTGKLNRKLIVALSGFGLAMGLATVFLVPSHLEPFFWIVIFLFCAVVIARKQPDRPFVHGLLTSILNSVWITAAHVVFFSSYIAHHQQEAAMMARGAMSPRVMMLATGPVVGLLSGLILGLLALAASKLIKTAPARSPA
jgi:hypothetical protein